MNTGQRHHRNCRGTSTLEFIVVLPFLMFVMMTAVELSRLMFTFNTIVQATREGARLGAVTAPANYAAIVIPRINAVLASSNVTPSATPTVTCTLPPNPPAGISATCGSDWRVTATVSVNFQTFVPMLDSLLSSIPLAHSSYMRYE
jgi:Flp pilus assembly protein TadG